MASGFGLYGVGRCFPIWRDYSTCLRHASHEADCLLFFDDYLECLHHIKTMERYQTIMRERERLIKAGKEKPGPLPPAVM